MMRARAVEPCEDAWQAVEGGEELTPSLTKRLTLTRSLASRGVGTETGKTGLEGLGAE